MKSCDRRILSEHEVLFFRGLWRFRQYPVHIRALTLHEGNRVQTDPRWSAYWEVANFYFAKFINLRTASWIGCFDNNILKKSIGLELSALILITLAMFMKLEPLRGKGLLWLMLNSLFTHSLVSCHGTVGQKGHLKTQRLRLQLKNTVLVAVVTWRLWWWPDVRSLPGDSRGTGSPLSRSDPRSACPPSWPGCRTGSCGSLPIQLSSCREKEVDHRYGHLNSCITLYSVSIPRFCWHHVHVFLMNWSFSDKAFFCVRLFKGIYDSREQLIWILWYWI